MENPSIEFMEAFTSLVEGLGYDIYDGVPFEDVPYPFVVMTDDVITDISPKTRHMTEILFPIHIWSAYDGTREARLIVADIWENIIDQEDSFNAIMSEWSVDSIELYNQWTNQHREGNQRLTQLILTLEVRVSKN